MAARGLSGSSPGGQGLGLDLVPAARRAAPGPRPARPSRIAGASCGASSFRLVSRWRRSGAAVPSATWTSAALTVHSACFSRALPARPGQNSASEGCQARNSAQCRATAGAGLSRSNAQGAGVAPGVVRRQRDRRDRRGRRQAGQQPPGSAPPERREPRRGTRPRAPTGDSAARTRRRTARAGAGRRGRGPRAIPAARRRRPRAARRASRAAPPGRAGAARRGAGRPSAPRPYALTAKIAPCGACRARACRVIPYRGSTSRSTPQLVGSSPGPGSPWGADWARTRSNFVSSSATGRPVVPSSERSMYRSSRSSTSCCRRRRSAGLAEPSGSRQSSTASQSAKNSWIGSSEPSVTCSPW